MVIMVLYMELLGVVNVPLFGCLDPYADNYNANAFFDDGSCIYFQEAVTFTKEDYADPNSEEAQDRILGNIWITRGNNKPLYNAALEGSYDDSHHDKSISPANTEWADGPTANHSSILSYKSLKSTVGSNFERPSLDEHFQCILLAQIIILM